MVSRKDEEEVPEAYLMQYYLVFSKKNSLMERKAINIFNIINVFIVKTKRKMWLYPT